MVVVFISGRDVSCCSAWDCTLPGRACAFPLHLTMGGLAQLLSSQWQNLVLLQRSRNRLTRSRNRLTWSRNRLTWSRHPCASYHCTVSVAVVSLPSHDCAAGSRAALSAHAEQVKGTSSLQRCLSASLTTPAWIHHSGQIQHL